MLVFPPVLSVVAGHGTIGIVAVHGAGTVILAMYTFIVGPWLPTSSVISSDLIHKPKERANIHLSNALVTHLIICLHAMLEKYYCILLGFC